MSDNPSAPDLVFTRPTVTSNTELPSKAVSNIEQKKREYKLRSQVSETLYEDDVIEDLNRISMESFRKDSRGSRRSRGSTKSRTRSSRTSEHVANFFQMPSEFTDLEIGRFSTVRTFKPANKKATPFSSDMADKLQDKSFQKNLEEHLVETAVSSENVYTRKNLRKASAANSLYGRTTRRSTVGTLAGDLLDPRMSIKSMGAALMRQLLDGPQVDYLETRGFFKTNKKTFMLHPYSQICCLWDIFMAILNVLNAILIPFTVTFSGGKQQDAMLALSRRRDERKLFEQC